MTLLMRPALRNAMRGDGGECERNEEGEVQGNRFPVRERLGGTEEEEGGLRVRMC